MSDRLAEIEARLAGVRPGPWDPPWDDARSKADRGLIYADLRDLLAVAKASRDALAAVMWDPTRHHELSTTRTCNTCGAAWPCEFARLRAALADLEGGAT